MAAKSGRPRRVRETPTTRRINPLTQGVAYDIGDVAEILKCSERKVWDLIADGHLRPFNVGRLVRVSRADLDAFMAHGGTQDAQAATS
jgi:excisionase family DNA binding protein